MIVMTKITPADGYFFSFAQHNTVRTFSVRRTSRRWRYRGGQEVVSGQTVLRQLNKETNQIIPDDRKYYGEKETRDLMDSEWGGGGYIKWEGGSGRACLRR